MKKILSILCALATALVLIAARLFFPCLPADNSEYVAEKYNGWSGVLRAWVCSDWMDDGSFIRWLNRCASAFEKMHNGVYLEFSTVGSETMLNFDTSGLRPPELVFFSPGVFTCTERLISLPACTSLHSSLQAFFNGKALPLAMGAYAWVYNSAFGQWPQEIGRTSSFTILPDDQGRCFSAALICLLSGEPHSADTTESPGDLSIDLGLPVNSAGESHPVIRQPLAFEQFINGEIPVLPVTQTELARLIRLQDSGRGPDWRLYQGSGIVCADQLLLAGATAQDGDGSDERSKLAQEFIAFLLTDEAQKELISIGAFTVTGKDFYPSFSPYAVLESMINSSTLAVPSRNRFSEQYAADSASIVRGFFDGKFSAKEALLNLGFECM